MESELFFFSSGPPPLCGLLLLPASPLVTQVLYKVCNSFVEMGSANVQVTDYLKGVGQYFPQLGQHSMSSFPGLLRPSQPALGQKRLFLLSSMENGVWEEFALGS